MTAESSRTFEFDVALSFAGEDRAYVGDIAEGLRSHDVRVFYDLYEQATLWGKDLYEHLDYVYRHAARYCVLFVSEHYARKVWTNHERTSAQARALQENEEYILPVRFDDIEIPGLRPTVGYIDARSVTSDQLVEFILRKLDKPRVLAGSGLGVIHVPRTADQQRRLLDQRPLLWEYLLFAGVLAQGKDRLEPKWRDHQLRYVRRSGGLLDDSQAITFIQGAIDDAVVLANNVVRVLDRQAQEGAFGLQGVSGDPVQIEHIAQRVVEIYEGFLDCAARIRSAAISDHLKRLFELAASWVDMPITQIRDFIDQCVAEVNRMPDRLANPDDRPIYVRLDLVIGEDNRIISDFNQEMKRVRKRGLFG